MKGIMKTLKWILGFGLFGWLGQAMAQNTLSQQIALGESAEFELFKIADGDKSVVYLS